MHYEDVGTEGFVLVERVPGSGALYRLFRAQRDGQDHEHRFVVSSAEVVRRRENGWTDEGAKGCLYPSP